MTTQQRPDSSPTTDAASPKIKEALDARDALAAALRQAGVQLPAMDIRTPWIDEREGEVRYALVHLGVCSAPVAHALATVIMNGIAR
ncbi:hypothetical protein OG215_06795 [Streptomyces globisporus]|uniref:hypothetical protein n=1 Tax=Streptomyces globisporus TaxID=1908 RepID=UPI003865858E|nr:hypothetical protein OG215_06795 [Streptomyces globisporus]